MLKTSLFSLLLVSCASSAVPPQTGPSFRDKQAHCQRPWWKDKAQCEKNVWAAREKACREGNQRIMCVALAARKRDQDKGQSADIDYAYAAKVYDAHCQAGDPVACEAFHTGRDNGHWVGLVIGKGACETDKDSRRCQLYNEGAERWQLACRESPKRDKMHGCPE